MAFNDSAGKESTKIVTTPNRKSNLSRAKPGWPPVLVGGSTQTAVVLMRDLARRGLRAYCAGTDARANGFRTVYGKGIISPDPETEPKEWIAHMTAVARSLGNKPVLIAAGDHYVAAMIEYADVLAKEYRFCHDTIGVLAMLATKQRQYEAASQFGMPIPRTQWVESLAEVEAFAAHADYPCLLKPRIGRQWAFAPKDHALHGQKIAFAVSAQELVDKYRMAAEISPSMVVQEVIQGPDTAKLVYLSCYGTDKLRRASCLFREFRTYPMQFGSASVVEPAVDADADKLCDQFLRQLGYAGLCEIELKRDSRDGQLKMIEANPRYSGTSDAAPYAGVPLGWIHYLDLIGEEVAPIRQNGRQFRHITLGRDIPTVGSYVASGIASWREIVWSYRPPVVFFDFSPLDWRLAARMIQFSIRSVLGAIYRTLFRRSRRNAS